MSTTSCVVRSWCTKWPGTLRQSRLQHVEQAEHRGADLPSIGEDLDANRLGARGGDRGRGVASGCRRHRPAPSATAASTVGHRRRLVRRERRSRPSGRSRSRGTGSSLRHRRRRSRRRPGSGCRTGRSARRSRRSSTRRAINVDRRSSGTRLQHRIGGVGRRLVVEVHAGEGRVRACPGPGSSG